MANTIPGLLDSRQGLNCVLAYHDQQGVVQSYRVRVNAYGYDYQLIADESQAKIRRAFYPHRVTPTEFSLNVLLKGTFEYRHFMDWLSVYSTTALSTNDSIGYKRVMLVALAGRDFVRLGIPISGFSWGDRVGSMLWSVTINFTAANDALATTDALPTVSTFEDAAAASTNADIQYFYPLSAFADGTKDAAIYDSPDANSVQLQPQTGGFSNPNSQHGIGGSIAFSGTTTSQANPGPAVKSSFATWSS